MNANKMAARIFGVFFILAFLAYGSGSAIIETISSAATGIANIHANTNLFIIGAILMGLVHTFLNIGLAVIMVPILKQYNKTLTYGYLSAAITATTILIVGVIFLLLLLPLSDEYIRMGADDTAYLQTLFTLLKKAGFYSYQIGMTIWGLGGLMLSYVLYESKLVPRAIAVWGLLGYVVFIAGTIFELFGIKIGLLLDIPGGLFEIFLSIWLITKGFKNTEPELHENSEVLVFKTAITNI